MTSLEGFRRLEVRGGELWFAEGFEELIEDLGLAERESWDRLVATGVPGGRGNIHFIERAGRRVAIKQLRRGGVAGWIWRERFLSRDRLLENLSIPRHARDHGVSTPATMALLAIPGPPGLWRGWLAIETVPGAHDIRKKMPERMPTAEEWTAALTAAREMHDAGIEHPDLNLGNILIDPGGRAWVIDLDGATVHDEPLDLDRRLDNLCRIERSYLKTCYLHDLEVDENFDWPGTYAPGNAAIAARWEQRRPADLARLRRHRRAWRR